jgi:hypothetical protein
MERIVIHRIRGVINLSICDLRSDRFLERFERGHLKEPEPATRRTRADVIVANNETAGAGLATVVGSGWVWGKVVIKLD